MSVGWFFICVKKNTLRLWVRLLAEFRLIVLRKFYACFGCAAETICHLLVLIHNLLT